MKRSVFILLMCFLAMGDVSECADTQQLKSLFADASSNPFQYNMGITILPGHSQNSDVLLLLHGYGGDNSIARILQSYGDISDIMVSFNFPDYRILDRQYDLTKSVYGSIDEILPVVYMLNKLVVDGKLDKVNLYGFSAGGGAVINTLAVLNTHRFDTQLASIGVGADEKKVILNAIQNGWVLLDAPLKSMNEVNGRRGAGEGRDAVSSRYNKNGFNPIDNIPLLSGLKLNIIVYWEVPDEILSNRDDALFSERLKAVNPNGRNIILEGSTGGHVGYHAPLFRMYNKLRLSEG